MQEDFSLCSSKKEISFRISNKPTSSTIFPLSNELNISIAYKILINAPHLYRVSSSCGVLYPKTKLDVNITYLKVLNDSSTSHHQFKFVFAPMYDINISHQINLGNFWLNVDKSIVNEELMNVVLKYDDPSLEYQNLESANLIQIEHEIIALRSLLRGTIEQNDEISVRILQKHKEINETKSKIQELKSQSQAQDKQMLIYEGDQDSLKQLSIPQIDQYQSKIRNTLTKLRERREILYNSMNISKEVLLSLVVLSLTWLAYSLIRV